MPDFLAQGDGELAAFMSNFAKNLPDVASDCNISPAQLDEYLQRASEFAEYYRLASEPNTRTGPIISGKNSSRSALKTMTRQFVARIRSSLKPTDPRLVDLGLKFYRKRRSQVSLALGAPMLALKAIDARTIQVRVTESGPTTRRGMPGSALGIILWKHVGDNVPDHFSEWESVGRSFRAIFPLTITGNHPPGTKIWLTAQWFSRRGMTSELATPKSIRLTFDSPVFAAQLRGKGKLIFDNTFPARMKTRAAA